MFQGMILTVLHSLHNHRVFMDQLWQTHLRQGRPLNPVAAASQKSLSLHSPPVHHLLNLLLFCCLPLNPLLLASSRAPPAPPLPRFCCLRLLLHLPPHSLFLSQTVLFTPDTIPSLPLVSTTASETKDEPQNMQTLVTIAAK